jgi:hypothetical protein
MSRFTFNRGSWEDGNSLPEWQDNEDFGAYLERIGYASSKASFGHEHGGQIEIYESSEKQSFYASVCPSGTSVFEVFLPDFPSMMMFLKDHAAAFSTESVNITQQETLNLLEKFFQFQHGHSAHSICQHCDPIGWAESVQTQEERRSKRGGNG